MTYDWKTPIEMARDLKAARYICLVCLGAVAVDFGHSLRFDYEMIKDKRRTGKIRWPQICYLIVKLAYFPYWTITFMVGEPSSWIPCDRLMICSEIFMAIITCLCSALLAFRTLCVWEQQCGKVFKLTLLLLWLALFSVWMVGSLDIRGSWREGIGEPWVVNQGACWFDPVPFRYTFKFMATVCFDATVLIVTIAGVLKAHGRSRIGSVLIEQGVLYFVVTLLFNVVLIIFCVLNLNDVMTIIFAVPTQTISVLAATRLYVLLFAHVGRGNKTFKIPSSTQSSSPVNPCGVCSKSLFSSSRAYDFGTNHADTSLTDITSQLTAEDKMNGTLPLSPIRGAMSKKCTSGDADMEKQMPRIQELSRTAKRMERNHSVMSMTTEEDKWEQGETIRILETVAFETMPAHLQVPHFMVTKDNRARPSEEDNYYSRLDYPNLHEASRKRREYEKTHRDAH